LRPTLRRIHPEGRTLRRGFFPSEEAFTPAIRWLAEDASVRF